MRLTGDVFKKRRTAYTIGISMTLFSLCFIFITVKGHVTSALFQSHAIPTDAVITRIIVTPTSSLSSIGRHHYAVVVRYSADNTLYDGTLNYYHSGLHVGKKVQIYVDTASPTTIMGSEEGNITLFFALMMLFFLIFGVSFTLYGMRLSKQIRKALG